MIIEIYSTKTCTYCKLAKEYFDSRGLKYKVSMIDEDKEKLAEVKEMGFMSVPVIKISDGQYDHVVKGFDKNALDEILNNIIDKK